MFTKQTLEFDVILQKIASFLLSNSAKTQLLEQKIEVELESILSKLEIVEQLSSVIVRFGRLPLLENYDIFKLLKTIELNQDLTINQILTLRLFLVMELNLSNYKHKLDSKEYQLTKNLLELNDHSNLLTELNLIMNIDGEILDEASSTLAQLRRQLRVKTKQLDEAVAKLLTKYAPYLNESIITTRNGRYVIPVKESFKSKVRGVIHDISSSKQTIYIEPDDIRQFTIDLETLKLLENDEIIKILSIFSQRVFPHYQTLNQNLINLINLDIFHAKAIYANEINGVKPRINDQGIIDLKNARHPLIDAKVVVPIDLKFDQQTKLILITGPNTGGKTVALKTLGLLTLMLQAGILVSVSPNSEMSIFKSIFADIGDEQSIEQSLSTFSSHLTKINRMIQQLEDNQLILLDELGSGTDPQEGVALAVSILDYLRQYQIKAMVTTHYSQLKLYALEHHDTINASVAFDFETLKPLYRINLGVSGQSQALHIASKLGLNPIIINKAKEYVGNHETDLSRQLEQFNQNVEKLKYDQDLVEKQLKQIEKEQENFKQQQRDFELQQLEVLENIRQTELKKNEKLRVELRELIEELEVKQNVRLPDLSSAKHKLNSESKYDHDTLIVDNSALEIGDYVLVIQYNQEGYVKAIKKDKYVVNLGQFDLAFERKNLRKLARPVIKEVKKTKISGTNPTREASYELDLRGVRYEEVNKLMDTAIDRAILANNNSLRVIHGHGTGIVRKAVYDYIKKSKEIKSSRFGGEGEGLNGVTIITLK